MPSFMQLIENITPEIYQNLKRAVELGKWTDGRKLTVEQKEICLQAMITWEMQHLPEDQRTGFMEQKCQSSKQEESEQPDDRFYRADTQH